ncbi:hypothetical protein GTP46_27730 [Duganella sp. FT135W]|uniref:Site-specific integrase n=1 Tax=Duganella flavida TaxID=2692175 RepID=A0A6L8KG43_9BURK|nr:hypothetical protein [Duganella flavida]MYM26423.1 hypothetical protein [Duganella flavida]
MNHIFITTSIYSNSTSKPENIPVLYVENGGILKPVNSVSDYIRTECSSMSEVWITKFCLSVRLLVDFIAAHPNYLDKPAKIYREFHRSIQYGTIDESGSDPSLLYWLPRSPKNSRNLLTSIDNWLDWVAKKRDFIQLNPIKDGNFYERQLNWMAYLNRSDKSLLGHLRSRKGAYEIAARVREFRGRRAPVNSSAYGTFAFPEEHFYDLLFRGFVLPGKDGELDPLLKYNWQAICITLLMNAGGVRVRLLAELIII